jgi:hypothetical protein
MYKVIAVRPQIPIHWQSKELSGILYLLYKLLVFQWLISSYSCCILEDYTISGIQTIGPIDFAEFKFNEFFP